MTTSQIPWADYAQRAATAGMKHIETELQIGGYDVPVRVQINGREWAGDDDAGEWVPGIGEIAVIANVYDLSVENGEVAYSVGEIIDPTADQYQMLRTLAAEMMRSLLEADRQATMDADHECAADVVDFAPADDIDQRTPPLGKAA